MHCPFRRCCFVDDDDEPTTLKGGWKGIAAAIRYGGELFIITMIHNTSANLLLLFRQLGFFFQDERSSRWMDPSRRNSGALYRYSQLSDSLSVVELRKTISSSSQISSSSTWLSSLDSYRMFFCSI